MPPAADDLGRLIDSCHHMDVHTHCDCYEGRSGLYRTLENLKILCFSAGMDPASSEKTSAMAKECPWIVPCTGIHPWKADQYTEESVYSQRKQYRDCPMISEIGLDTVWAGDHVPLNRQIPLLQAQLKLAREYDKPVTLHTKGAEREIMEILSGYALSSVLIHWYDGPEDIFRALAEYGCYFTIPPAILADPAYKNLILQISPDRLLPETDNPGTWPWYFKKKGQPEQIREIYGTYARLCSRSTRDIHIQFKDNLKRFLRLETGEGR